MRVIDILDLLNNHYWKEVRERTSLSDSNTNNEWFDELIYFTYYAYERNVPRAAQIYREAAKTSLEVLKTRHNWSEQIQANIWSEFLKTLPDGVGANKKMNPLAPEYNNRKNLAKFAWYICDDEHPTIAKWVFNMIRMNNISYCHNEIMKIRGIRNKIASFYMRDIFWLGTALNPTNDFYKDLDDLYLLQPVDTWIRKAASAIGCKIKSDSEIAKYMSSFESERGLAPGGSNIALWMLGAHYLNDDEDFDNIVRAIFNPSNKSKEYALNISYQFIDYYGKFGKIMNEFLS